MTVSAEYTTKYTGSQRKPCEIYDIWNNYDAYYLTSGDVPITYNGQEYTPTAISRSGTQRNVDMGVSQITVTIDYLQEEVVQYLGSAPADRTWLRVMKVFRDQSPIEAMVYFIGTLANTSFQGLKGTLRANGIEFLLKMLYPKWRYGPRCNHTLYSTGCGVTKASYAVAVTVASISANARTITINEDLSSYGEDYFNYGYVQPAAAGPRMITSHDSSSFTVKSIIPGLAVSDSLTIYAGCNKSPSECQTKFNNLGNPSLNNFMGFIYIPDDNPAMWTD